MLSLIMACIIKYDKSYDLSKDNKRFLDIIIAASTLYTLSWIYFFLCLTENADSHTNGILHIEHKDLMQYPQKQIIYYIVPYSLNLTVIIMYSIILRMMRSQSDQLLRSDRTQPDEPEKGSSKSLLNVVLLLSFIVTEFIIFILSIISTHIQSFE